MARQINNALSAIPRSGIRRITDHVMGLGPVGRHIIHLGLGQPQEPTSDIICQALADASISKQTKYTLNAGMLELRLALKEKLKVFNKAAIDEGNIYITPGATYGVAIAIGAMINPGDEVLVPDPGYPNFSSAALHYGGKVKYYMLKAGDAFQLDMDCLESQISDKTKLIVINSPSNPTGAVFSKKHIEQLVELTARRDIWLLSDEVYETYVYEGEHVSPLSFPAVEHVVGIYSFSKSYNMTGLRVGYIATADSRLHANLINAQELYVSCAPTVSQVAALHVLRHGSQVAEDLYKGFLEKRNAALRILGSLVSYIPHGAFYIMVDISATGMTSDQFADELLLEKQVAVAPGATFGPSADKYIRIAFTAKKDSLEVGVQRIREFIEERTRYGNEKKERGRR